MRRRTAKAFIKAQTFIGLLLVGIIVWLIVAIIATLLAGCVANPESRGSPPGDMPPGYKRLSGP
jgi:hypothetical protein